MKLTVMERLILMAILPGQGDYTTLKLVRKLRESLSFSESEHKELDFQTQQKCPKCENSVFSEVPVQCEGCGIPMQSTSFMKWNPKANLVKDVHMGDKTKEIITSTLKRLDEQKQLTQQTASIYERFIPDGDDEESK